MPRLKKRRNVLYKKKKSGKEKTITSASTAATSSSTVVEPSTEVEHKCISQMTSMDHQYCSINTLEQSALSNVCHEHNPSANNSPTSAFCISTNLTTETECYPYIHDEVEVCIEETCDPVPSPHMFTYETLKQDIIKVLEPPYIMNTSYEKIQILQLYPAQDIGSVKLSLIVEEDFTIKLFVHKIEVTKCHDFWTGLPIVIRSEKDVSAILEKLKSFSLCVGNFDEDWQNLIPIGSCISQSSGHIQGYREGDFGAVQGDVSYSSTIRNVHCKLLVLGARCTPCSQLRNVLRNRYLRAKEKLSKSAENTDNKNYLNKSFKHCNMSRSELVEKIHQQKSKITSLEMEIGKLKRQFHKELASAGVNLDQIQSLEMSELMSLCRSEVESAFPDGNSYQRLFWNEQAKCASVRSASGMRWHPFIIRWCLYLRQKSSAAYEALRDSGFISLPSARTLFDYTHYIKSALGFQKDVLIMLKEEAEKKGMYMETSKCYVGILFDEIKVKSDLVYDKHTGELIGYCNLDKVGNQIMDLERQIKDSPEEVAKFMLVLMVRGITTNLKFPLAGFATSSITADFLYPIIWKAVRLVELNAKLKVLFLTCDGASANRKFFNIHRSANGELTYYTTNPYDQERKVYFISDVPHLLKTTRNCFANSGSHKNTRKLWKEGKDISWLHILNLFEDHCELGIYNPCPKISRSHVDLNAFSFMKVNLAAQVLSSTVANSLEMLYGDNVTETVNFIRTMDKFFDCLNVRNLYEGRNKRNPNLSPYTSPDDARLTWLTDQFLGYFDIWEQSVRNRVGNFSAGQKNSMLLSHQTLQGLRISVHSIVSCVKFLLENGVDFVLTNVFNQDPLEQHFGHYRHRVGDNCNPTVYDVRNTMTQLRTVGAHALAPKRGNTSANNENCAIDNSKIPRRKSLPR